MRFAVESLPLRLTIHAGLSNKRGEQLSIYDVGNRVDDDDDDDYDDDDDDDDDDGAVR